MIATALWVLAHALGARRADRDGSATALPTTSSTPVFHPPGAIRLLSPAEETARTTQRDRRAMVGAARGATGARPAFQHPDVPGRLAAAGTRR